MATKKTCDRCELEAKPGESFALVAFTTPPAPVPDVALDLCGKCRKDVEAFARKKP